MAEALRILIARKEELGEAFGSKPFKGAVDLSGGLCMTPITGRLVAAIDTRVDPGAWIGETAAMMSRRGPVVFAEIGGDDDSGPAQAAVAWTGGKRIYAGRDGIDGLVPAEETGPEGGIPVDRALEAAFGIEPHDDRSPSQEAGLPRWRSNDQLLAAVRRQAGPEKREPRAVPPEQPEMVIRFSYDAELLHMAMTAGGRTVLGRLRGWRRQWPLIAGLSAGALMVAIGFAAPLIGLEIDLLSGGIGILIGATFLPLMIRGSQRSLHAAVMETPVMRAPMEVELRAEGVLARNALAETALTWDAVDDVVELGRGFGLLSGALVIPLPAGSFPKGVDRAMLRARISAWRGKP